MEFEDFFKKNLNNIELMMDDNFVLHGKSKMIERLGFFPTSVWTPDTKKSSKLKEIINDKSQCRESLNRKKAYRRSGINNGKTSVFNPHLTQKILAAYCDYNSKIYDPFAGGGTRGYIASRMGHKYTGVEIREEEVKRIKEMFKKWGFKFDLLLGDSIKLKQEKESFDFSFTCPPYYDLELYSNLDGDLSNSKSYDEFLININKVLKNTFNALKKDSFCVWVVGNFRDKNGKMYHLNGDIVRLAKSVGFTLWDEVIWKGASNMALTRCGNFEKNRKIIRMHEYVLVFVK